MMRLERYLLLSMAFGLGVVACYKKDDPGFGSNDGVHNDIPNDTDGPEVDSGDTGDADDTGDTADAGGDTGDTADTADSADTDPGEIIGTGYAVGDVAYDLQAKTQTDVVWSLHAQYGSPVVLVFGDYLEGNFQYIAGYLDDISAAYADQDVVVVAALILGADTAAADRQDAAAFADSYDLNTVLYVSDPGDQTTWASTRPKVYLIDREMIISQIGYNIVDQDEIEAWLDAL